MRKARTNSVDEPCSRRQKLAKVAGVPVKIAEIASICDKDDKVVMELIERLKAVRAHLTLEQRVNIFKLGLVDRIAFVKKVLGEKDSKLLNCSDIMFNYHLAKFLSSQDDE